VDGGSPVVNQYVLKNGAATAVAYYWYQGRGRIVANEYAVKWNLLRDAALLGHTEEALVRIVVPVVARGTADPAMVTRALADASVIGDALASRMIKEVARALPGKNPATPVS
jgi:EpsI family protein